MHPNTVRYRLKRISEVIGWDATGAREALILQAALIVGSIARPTRLADSRRAARGRARSCTTSHKAFGAILVGPFDSGLHAEQLAGWNP